jgi:hypothetical protein
MRLDTTKQDAELLCYKSRTETGRCQQQGAGGGAKALRVTTLGNTGEAAETQRAGCAGMGRTGIG